MPKKTKGEGAAPAPAPAADVGVGAGADAKSKKPVLILVGVVVVAVLGAGAMAGGLIGGGGDTAEAAEPTATPTPTELGTLVQLEALTVNLADGRFLKIGAALELAPGVAEEPPTAPVYDAIISEFNVMTVEQMTDPAQRDATKQSLLDALGQIYGDDIVGVYYTEFVMQ